jgi:outer membrane protein assembly factor BamD (BamD/ComL family)
VNNGPIPIDSQKQTTTVDNTPSFDNLVKNVPLTPEQLKVSNDSISNALFGLGAVLLNEAEDYLSAIDAYEKLRTHYPSFPNMSEVVFQLYYAYLKSGNTAKANEMKQLLLTQYAGSRFATILTTGKDPVASSNKIEEATRTYDDIYNLFLEGRFEEAEAAKIQADTLYKTNYWQPQLLYIEAVYHIRQRDDSIAKNNLQTLIAQDPNSPMAKKAQTMIDVLNRRSQIEDELSKYEIQNVQDTTTKNPIVQAIVQSLPRQKDTASYKPNMLVKAIKNDSLAKRTLASNSTVKVDTTVKKTADILPLIKKDTTAKKPDVVSTAPPTKKDTVAKKPDVVSTPPPVQKQVVQTPPVEKKAIVIPPLVRKDTIANKPLRKPGEYYFDSTTKHYTAIILDKVDPLFVTEVKNAYFRFNREHYRSQTFTINVVDLDATRKIVLIGDFPTAREAVNYMQFAKQSASSEVMPWLKADKYAFSIITDDNLPLLLEKKDLEQYKKFLVQNLPVKF